METPKPTVIVTGISGNLGQRLVPLLPEYSLVGVDVKPPTGSTIHRFVPLDLGKEDSTRELVLRLREFRPASVCTRGCLIYPPTVRVRCT